MPPSLEKFHDSVECFEWWEHTEWPWPSRVPVTDNVRGSCILGNLKTCWGKTIRLGFLRKAISGPPEVV